MVVLEIKRVFCRHKPQDMDNNQSCDKISNGEENEGDINCPEEVGTALFLHLFYVYLTRFLSLIDITLMIASFSSVLPIGGIGWPFRVNPRLHQKVTSSFILPPLQSKWLTDYLMCEL